MADIEKLHEPWLIAAWPGMGNVAIGAAAYLVDKLGASLVHELPSHDLFDIQHVQVKSGMARAGRLPRSMVFEWTGVKDLMIFIGEAQPSANGYALCNRLLDYAQSRGVTRFFTFAAMATQLHPSNDPRVFGVANEPQTLQEIKEQPVEILREGQIGGLNGVLLAAGAERRLPGICLMGELPFFAAGVPNPKASRAALNVFCRMAGIDLDFDQIDRQAETVEQGLLQMLEKMRENARQESEEEGFAAQEFPPVEGDEPAADDDEVDDAPAIDYAIRRKIESLFEEAAHDRTRAFQLKEELDRHGVFKQYEDRFLDLFKKAE